MSLSELMDSETKLSYKSKKKLHACPCDESKMYDQFLMPIKSKGMWVWFDGEEEPYLDLVLNYSSVNFGHCYPPIVEIVNQVTQRVDQIHAFHSKDKLDLSEYLSNKISRDEHYNVYFNVGGSAAVADAIRLCRYATGKKHIISFDGSFHGVSNEAVCVTDNRLVKKEQYGIPIAEYNLSVPFPSLHNDISVEACMSMIESLIAEYDVAGIIVEPIQGANGFIIPKDTFLAELSNLCKKHSLKFIIDEIQVGFGRAGSFFVFQEYGVETPDIVLLSKSIAGGYFPVSAVIAKADLYAKVSNRGTAFQTTFNNSSMGLAISNQLMHLVEREKLFDSIPEKGQYFMKKIDFFSKSPYVANLRGKGLAIAFDIVDPDSKQPSDTLAKQFVSICLQSRVIIYACGVNFNSVKIIPSIVITREETDLIARRLKNCLNLFHKKVS
ncbi:aspartate aminotransferase family protein [Desulfobacula phenolica]|uniref:4-aminobutyrate aminotransferase / (S)-3-amino-2-methylpropionate transaminase n=1 Tax=Desulfobacula phenolica TaxID=90732 RepID=A0A1H2DNP1_9BACT|nr:aspartate aminotransferase family protein [Desulfobacula phenolica]SDT84459.1 4-aminobutyrate aminotransferase / (S)-3-amino-2-methylpropionate transaminase [Desulfobacula phenolica]